MEKKRITIGIVAHVDAGKTTLSESMLYVSGVIRQQGRVDRRDSFLDTGDIERARGITVFSKQAVIPLPNTELYLIDTPGHVDFSAETERALQILDYAVLVISGTDGVQAHTETVWDMLRRYRVPCFIFITKMDLPVCDRAALMNDLHLHLSEGCISFSDSSASMHEQLAMCGEKALEEYLESGEVSNGTIAQLVADRKVFPCYFGSGLKNIGVEELLAGLDEFILQPRYPDDFSATVYKIMRDAAGERLTCMKITGGSLKVRTALQYSDSAGKPVTSKVNQLRLYCGLKYTTPEAVYPGQVCAVTGLESSYAGQILGRDTASCEAMLSPVLSYYVLLPKGIEPAAVYPKFMQLAEEDPMLGISYIQSKGQISVSLMGSIQAEVFTALVKERFDLDISLDRGHVLYRESILDRVEGIGHFEPLRHYAEVHLILEPLPEGSGIQFASSCPEDELDRNWQRLILTNLAEKQHLGVLTGSPITDIKITLASGRAHIKHTEGGDFRQATYRAVRQGLMQAQSVLLEPYYAFTAELAPDIMGRLISDVREMGGEINSPQDVGGNVRITGAAPVARMNGYYSAFAAFTHGRGKLALRPDGYRPCKNSQELIQQIAYSPLSDLDNTPDSVFCSHGAGTVIPWNQVTEYMHLESVLKKNHSAGSTAQTAAGAIHTGTDIDDAELERIMEREFGPIRRPMYTKPVRDVSAPSHITIPRRASHVLVDGYNVIFSWPELKALAADNIDLARERLSDILSDYAAFTECRLALVFDAYRTPSGAARKLEHNGISIAYTAEGETADAYIERLADEIGKNYNVRVVTNDSLIRLSALGAGILRTSSDEFRCEVEQVLEQIAAIAQKTRDKEHTTVINFKQGDK